MTVPAPAAAAAESGWVSLALQVVLGVVLPVAGLLLALVNLAQRRTATGLVVLAATAVGVVLYVRFVF